MKQNEITAENKRIVLLGFRSNTKWKKIVSCIYLVIVILYFITGLFSGMDNDISFGNFLIEKLKLLISFVLLISPYVLFSKSPLNSKIPLINKGNRIVDVISLFVVFLLTTAIISGFNSEDDIENSDVDIQYDDSITVTELPATERITSSSGITELKIKIESIVLSHGEKEEYSFEVIGEDDFDIDDIEFISENKNVAVVEYSSDSIWDDSFTITATGSGNTNIYIQTKDGIVKSELIPVTVEQSISKIIIADSDEITMDLNYETEYYAYINVEPYIVLDYNIFTAVSENEEIATIDIEETYSSFKYIITAHEPGETEIYIKTNDNLVESKKLKVVVTKDEIDYEEVENQGSGITVYITPYGKKYHYSSACAGDNAMARDLYDVQGAYGACKKCAQ